MNRCIESAFFGHHWTVGRSWRPHKKYGCSEIIDWISRCYAIIILCAFKFLRTGLYIDFIYNERYTVLLSCIQITKGEHWFRPSQLHAVQNWQRQYHYCCIVFRLKRISDLFEHSDNICCVIMFFYSRKWHNDFCMIVFVVVVCSQNEWWICIWVIWW